MCSEKNNNATHKSKGSDNCNMYLMIPGIIVFITLIILLNLDYTTNQNYDAINHTKVTAIWHFGYAKVLTHFSVDISESPFASERVCEESTDPCSFDCEIPSNDELNKLVAQHEILYEKCEQGLQLTLRGAPFSDDETFGKAHLNGDFKLSTLKLDKCEKFSKIENNAFDKPSLNSLKNLTIIQSDGNGIETINENTFKGLNELKLFVFVNARAPKKLTAEAVLTPFAETLEELIFVQNSVQDLNGYDPGSWFWDAAYPKLKNVNLNDNYFPGTLNEKAFEKLESLETLQLASCSIETLRDNTFEPIMGTLKYLDLSSNELVTLSYPIVARFANSFVALEISGNNWDCDCEHEEFMEHMKLVRLNYIAEPLCVAPAIWAKQPITLVELCCHEQCEGPTPTAATSDTTSMERTLPPTVGSEQATLADYESTSPESVHQVSLVCKLPLSEDQQKINEITLEDQLSFFHIVSVSASSVLITFERPVSNHDLFYFTPHKNDSRQQQTIRETNVALTALFTNHSYVFCLTMNAQLVTPFDCRSHHMAQQKVGWISVRLLPIFLAIAIATTTICFTIGMLATCCILRCGHKWVPKDAEIVNAEIDLQPANLAANTARVLDEQTQGALKKNGSPRADRLTSNSYVQYFNNAESPPPVDPSTTEEVVDNKFKSRHLKLELETIAEDYGSEIELE